MRLWPAWLQSPRTPGRILFLGDSITEMWSAADPRFFAGERINAGIGGETTRDMLARFDDAAIAPAPDVIHLMGGTNDLWHGDPGPDAADAGRNIAAMIDRARAHGIAMVIALPPPIGDKARRLLRHPALVKPLRTRLAEVARANGAIVADYAGVLTGRSGALRSRFTTDGIHLSRAGYRALSAPAEAALRAAAASR